MHILIEIVYQIVEVNYYDDSYQHLIENYSILN